MKIFLSDVTPTSMGSRGRIWTKNVISTSTFRAVAYMLGASIKKIEIPSENCRNELRKYSNSDRGKFQLSFNPSEKTLGEAVDLTQPHRHIINTRNRAKISSKSIFWGSEKSRLVKKGLEGLTSESVEGLALSFQGIDDIHGGDSLPLGVFRVGDSITDDILKENFEDTTGFFVDESRDCLLYTSPSPRDS